MSITKEAVRDILKTLPIGYYIGRNIPVEVDDSITSHYDILNDIIRINTQMVADTVNKLPQTEDSNVEEDTRAMLYHELSHAMLTPKTLEPCDEINIIEDARIEHLNKGYFYGVDFDEFNTRYLSDTPSDSPGNAFIRFCELGELPEDNQEFVNLWYRLQDLFKTYNISKLNATTDDWNVNYYYSDCKRLYEDFIRQFNKSKKDQQKSNKQNQNGKNQNSGNKGSQNSNSQNNNNKSNSGQIKRRMSSSSNDQKDKNNENQQSIMSQQSGKGKGNEQFDENQRKKFLSIIQKYEDPKFMEKLRVIINNYKKMSSRNSSAINTYSGVFDTRAAALRDDYKYFLQKNRQGNNKAFSKLHFNLFLDSSSSFRKNEPIALMIIKSLCWLERQIQDFSFTLITCDVGERIVPKKNITYSARGGTNLSFKIFNTFKEVQKADAHNFNIVLYDGEATENSNAPGTNGAPSNFKAFNSRNTMIITDPSNANAVEKYCPSAQKIISVRYTDELINNLLMMLSILLK